MSKHRIQHIAVLDIGTAKTVCLIAKTSYKQGFDLLGIGYCASKGVKSGRIIDIDQTEVAVKKSILAAEQMSGERIKKIYLSISANHLISHRVNVNISITGHEINSRDLQKLLLLAKEGYQQHAVNIIHTFVYDYILDGYRGVTNPLGMYGDKLASSIHMVSIPSNTLLNFNSCITNCNLTTQGYIADSYASGIACLTADEMDMGVNIIDFGAGSTSFAVFEKGYMTYSDSIQLGGFNITNDIAIALGVSIPEAERLKNLYGGSIITDNDKNEMIEVADSSNNDINITQINRELLIKIIRARADEIIEMIMNRLNNSGIKIANRLVITGGGARLVGLRDLLAHFFSTKVRIGYPKGIKDIESSINLELNTAIGMLSHIEKEIIGKQSSIHHSLFKRIAQWLYDYLHY